MAQLKVSRKYRGGEDTEIQRVKRKGERKVGLPSATTKGGGVGKSGNGVSYRSTPRRQSEPGPPTERMKSSTSTRRPQALWHPQIRMRPTGDNKLPTPTSAIYHPSMGRGNHSRDVTHIHISYLCTNFTPKDTEKVHTEKWPSKDGTALSCLSLNSNFIHN